MQATIKFAPNTDLNHDLYITVNAEAGPEKFKVEFDTADGDDMNQHKIIIADGRPLDLPHYSIARIVLEASLMLDSHFADEGEPYSEKTFEA